MLLYTRSNNTMILLEKSKTFIRTTRCVLQSVAEKIGLRLSSPRTIYFVLICPRYPWPLFTAYEIIANKFINYIITNITYYDNNN